MLFFHDRSMALGPVSDAETAALARVHGSAGRPTLRDRETSAGVLRAARARHDWVACDCRRRDGGSWALLSPRQLLDGSVTLVRHASRAHASDCVFFREPDEMGAAHATNRLGGTFVALERDDVVSPTTVAGVMRLRAASWVAREDRLLKLATRVVNVCGFRRIEAAELGMAYRGRRRQLHVRDVVTHYQRVDAVADTPVAGAIRVDDVWANHLAGVAGLGHRLGRAELAWPNDVQPQGFLVGVVGELREGPVCLVTSTRDGREIAVPVRRSVSVLGCDRGPFVCVGVLGAVDGRFELVDVALVPVVSKSVLLAVTDGLQRRFATLLLEQLIYWRERRGVNVRLDSVVPGHALAAIGVRFVLTPHDRGPVGIVLNDSDRVAGAAERARTVGGLADCVVLDARGGDEAHWRRQLTAAVLRAQPEAA